MAGSLLVFDTEATDLEPGQICQLAYLLEHDGEITARNYFFSVDDMSPGAQEVHGFSKEMLEELSKGAWFEDKAAEILTVFNAAGTVAGHNVRADERYLRVEMERLGLRLKRLNTFCTMNYASGIMNMKPKVVTGRPKPPKLSELAAYYDITPEQVQERTAALFGEGEAGLHDARFDTVMTWLCLRAAVNKGDLRGL